MSLAARVLLITVNVILGVVFICCNFGGLLRNLAKAFASPDSATIRAVAYVTAVPAQVLGGSYDDLYQWMLLCFFGVWLYVGVLLLLGLVRQSGQLAGSGLLGLVGGLASLTVVSWIGLAVFWIVWLVLKIVGFVFGVFGAIFGWIVKLLVVAFPLLLALAVVGALALLWKEFGPKALVIATAICTALYFLWPGLRWLVEEIFLPILRWCGRLIAALLGWVPAVLVWLFTAAFYLVGGIFGLCMIVGIVGSMGCILLDQIRTAFQTGRDHKGVLLGSFSLGTSLALILLVSAGRPEMPVPAPQPQTLSSRAPRVSAPAGKSTSRRTRRARKVAAIVPPAVTAPPTPQVLPPIATAIDRAWQKSAFVLGDVSIARVFLSSLPRGIREWAERTFRSASAPLFDSAVLLLLLALSLGSVMRAVFSRSDMDFKVSFYNRDLAALATLPIVVLLLVVSASEDNQG